MRCDAVVMFLFLDCVQFTDLLVGWQLARVALQSVAEVSHDRAPGPDGVPYAPWARAFSQLLAPVLPTVDGAPRSCDLPAVMSAFWMVLIPSAHTVSRNALARPLVMLNSDFKLVGLAVVNVVLVTRAGRTVHVQQRVFAAGTSMYDNVVEV